MTDSSAPKLAAMFRDRQFWQQLAPGLGIEEIVGGGEDWGIPFPDDATLQALLDCEGYVHLRRLQDPESVRRRADAVRRLAGLGIPPVFCMVYDAFWTPAHRLSRVLKAAFGATYVMLPHFWIWHVDPAKSESGWRPHRETGSRSLFADGRPKALSAWLALSEATPLNGCMYVVPADRDPAYGTEKDNDNTFELSDIRALPADPGDVFVWNQALLHWGGHASSRAASPRMSMAFEFMHADVEPYGLPIIQPGDVPSFDDRLNLISRQIIQYRHMAETTPELESMIRAL